MHPTRVLFIGGTGRSGSTIIDMVLGRLPGFVSLGEVRHIWQRGVVENQLCSCGAPFRSCEFWTEVLRAGFGGVSATEAKHFAALTELVGTKSFYLSYRFGRHRRRSSKARLLREYLDIVSTLFDAISSIAGGGVLVDSTKYPTFASYYSRAMPRRVSMLHIVRDPRGVAFSWLRKKPRPEIVGQRVYMPRYSSFVTARRWLVTHALCEVIRREVGVSARVYYEDFAREPYTLVDAVARIVDGTAISREEFEARLAQPPDSDYHLVSGNPARFGGARLDIRYDIEWRTKMARWRKALIAAETFPLAALYGYVWPGQRRYKRGERE